MDIPGYFNENIFSVTEINECVKEMLDAVPVFSGVRIRGEISNFKRHSSGHLYFSLKDEGSVIKAVMFARDARSLGFTPEDGMRVVASGRISAYVQQGAYQFYVNAMTPDGKGELYAAFERLKKRLSEEGLFSDKYKKPLPKYPERIGVITSNTGAAIRDIINITGRRYPLAEIVVYPALVQGDGSVASLIAGVKHMTETVRPDVVIIGRGGGSIEDLWSFNSEALAREIISSDIPFISAVGHETDFTICDFACSVRAPTPSGAAELAVPDIKELERTLSYYRKTLSVILDGKIKGYKDRLNTLSEKRVIRSPYGFIDERRQSLDVISDRARRIWELKHERAGSELGRLCEKLNALSPLGVLSRGYSALYGESGEVVTSVTRLKNGDTVTMKLVDGEAVAEVKNIKRQM